MKKPLSFCIIALITIMSCKNQNNNNQTEDSKTILFEENEEQVLVHYGDKLISKFNFDDTLRKPLFFPVKTISGKNITRNFPLAIKAGEQVDHVHQRGFWFNFGDVNGVDFWNSSYERVNSEKHQYGWIKTDPKSISLEDNQLHFTAYWCHPSGDTLLKQKASYTFNIMADDVYGIIAENVLIAKQDTVWFKDNKEGLFAIRLARELEMDSKQPAILTKEDGSFSDSGIVDTSITTGQYIGSIGTTGYDVWGTPNKWIILNGQIENEPVSVMMMDHPENINHPARNMARGYGLFSLNNLGQQVFEKEQPYFQLSLARNDSISFKHALIISNNMHIDKAFADSLFSEFSKH